MAGAEGCQIEQQHLVPDRGNGDAPEDEVETFREATRRFQAELVRRCRDATGWNLSERAQRLDVARSHLHGLISTFGIERTDT